jgi:hypothetical protein
MSQWGTRLSTTSNRQTKRQLEQLFAELLDRLASEGRQGSRSSAAGPEDQRGDAAPLANRVPPRSGGRGEIKSEEVERL